MADVLIVCVREDEPQAKALAEMFEAAGFSIGGAPGSDAALRSSGAGVIVWSQASIRSRTFLDAAQRVINAGKAVIASLIEAPPPSSVGDAPTFELLNWSGDPDDPALDPLFFAVDRMVNSARASVGAEPAAPAPAPFTPPPNLRPPPQPAPRAARPAPPPPPAPAPDALGVEAEHWRAIRDSRDPSVFLDYLARYGASGAFAEVAELRLKQLTDAAPAPAPAAPRPAPARRPEPPAPAPRRAEAPPPRRPDPPPAPPRRPPPPERRFERIETREPPRGEGGALRAFVLIVLLGGAAVAGALYFGGNVSESGAAREQSAEFIAPPPPLDGEPADAAEGEGEAFSDLASAAPAARAPAPQAAPQPAPRPPAAPAREEPEPPTPAPVTSWAGSESAGGPVALSPGPQGGAPSNIVPLGPPAATPAPAPPPEAPTQTAARQPLAPAPAGTVVWAQRPTARQIAASYPARAMRDGVGGRVVLDCSVLGDLSVACTVTSESPAGMGFARAAVTAAQAYRARATLTDGASSVGARARISVLFQAPTN